MKQFFTTTLALLSFSFFLSCSSSSDNNGDCEKSAHILSNSAFDQVSTINYTITAVTLNEDCLDVTVSSSGCDATTWTMNLFASNANSGQRNVKIELQNLQLCLTVLQKTVSYNLIPLRIAGQHQVTLNIAGLNQPVVYNY